MKNTFYIAALFLISCGDNSTNQSIQVIEATDSIKEFEMSEPRLTAVDFNNEMTFMQDAMLQQVDELFNSDSTNIDHNLENTLFELELNLESLENMKAPGNSEALVTAMKKLVLFYRSEFTGPFGDIVTLIKKADWTKADEKKVDEYDKQFVASEKAWFDTVFVEQEKFATANNIKLEEQF